jgi:enoyl-CoA hydratase/carnithine racemase
MSNDYKTFRYENRTAVGTLTLSRPTKRNAMNPQMRRELVQLGDLLATDDTLRCLIVTGDGPSFCAGIDLTEDMAGTLAQFSERPIDDEIVDLGLVVAGALEWLPRLPCPSVAAVAGHAYGAGLQLAIACDFRIFADNARVGLTEMRYGLLPDMGATFRLPRMIGDSRARELILFGEVIDAKEALRIGLANRVVPTAQLETSANQLAERLASQPPVAVREARRAIDAGWRLDPAVALRQAVKAQAACLASADFKEARQALSDDRRPEWSGR